MSSFVTLEGLDGSGKSTVLSYLRKQLPEAVFTREPTSPSEDNQAPEILEESWTGPLVRERLRDEEFSEEYTLFFLFMLDHAWHVENVVMPNMRQKNTLVSDRYIDSRCAYQAAALKDTGKQDTLEWILDIHSWSVFPDKTILIDVPASVSAQRIENNDSERFERQEFLSDVRENYIELAERFNNRYAIVDGTQSKEDVAEECYSVLKRLTD